MVIFAVTNINGEGTQYRMLRYVSNNEAIGRIFSFAIHEKYPTVSPFRSLFRKWRCIFQSREQGGQNGTTIADNQQESSQFPKHAFAGTFFCQWKLCTMELVEFISSMLQKELKNIINLLLLVNIRSHTCNMPKNRAMAKKFQVCKLSAWDEFTMAHIKSLKELNKTLRGVIPKTILPIRPFQLKPEQLLLTN